MPSRQDLIGNAAFRILHDIFRQKMILIKCKMTGIFIAYIDISEA